MPRAPRINHLYLAPMANCTSDWLSGAATTDWDTLGQSREQYWIKQNSFRRNPNWRIKVLLPLHLYTRLVLCCAYHINQTLTTNDLRVSTFTDESSIPNLWISFKRGKVYLFCAAAVLLQGYRLSHRFVIASFPAMTMHVQTSR